MCCSFLEQENTRLRYEYDTMAMDKQRVETELL